MFGETKNRLLVAILLLSFGLALAGCSKKEFAARIADFQAGIEETTTATSVYYSELNTFERDLYLQERLLDPSKDILTTERDPRNPAKKIPTALVGKVFSAESIKARTDAIKILGVYGKRLADLAGSDAPERFATGSNAVASNLTKLGATFSTLTNDDTAKNYVAPLGALGKIFGAIGRALLESKRDAALTNAVREGAPIVRKIIRLLEDDLENVIAPLRTTGSHQALAELINNYNTHRTTMSLDQRQKAIDEIRRAQQRYDIALAFNPSQLMDSMRDAHEALVKYATSKRTPQSLAELVDALSAFRDRAQIVLGAVIELRNLRRGTV